MQFDKAEFEAGQQWGRSSHLAKREQAAPQTKAEALKSRDERIREWGERARAEQAETQARTANPTTIRTRVLSSEEVRHVGRPGTSYAIGDTRPAMDGTKWKRIG